MTSHKQIKTAKVEAFPPHNEEKYLEPFEVDVNVDSTVDIRGFPPG